MKTTTRKRSGSNGKVKTNGRATTNGRKGGGNSQGRTGDIPNELMFSRIVSNMVENVFSTSRRALLSKILDERRDIDEEAGYPKVINSEQYRLMYDREGIATRVVQLMPEESWALDPTVQENEEVDETDFEKAWDELVNEHNIYSALSRIDELSGIGHYGVLLLGFDDGLELNEPVEGIDENGKQVGNVERELIFVRCFDENLVRISSYQRDETSPRFGLPTKYEITFVDPTTQETGASAFVPFKEVQTTVHWSRIIHIADNRKTSEVFGVPRMQTVFNRLMDLRKLLGGSAEMFWKGAFPGYSFEVNPELGDVEIDQEDFRKQFDDFSNGLQRYIALAGMHANSLAPQTADPSEHFMVQLRAIAIACACPVRIFMGSEAAQLASAQDTRTWNRRVDRRRNKYVAPMIIRPFIDRLVILGVLPEVGEDGYFVTWPDLNTPTDKDKADVAEKMTRALALYIQSGADIIVPPLEFLTTFLDLTTEEAEAIIKAATKIIAEEEADAEVMEEEQRLREEANIPDEGETGDEGDET